MCYVTTHITCSCSAVAKTDDLRSSRRSRPGTMPPALIQDQQASGLNVRKWCDQNNIKQCIFFFGRNICLRKQKKESALLNYHWQKRLQIQIPLKLRSISDTTVLKSSLKKKLPVSSSPKYCGHLKVHTEKDLQWRGACLPCPRGYEFPETDTRSNGVDTEPIPSRSLFVCLPFSFL